MWELKHQVSFISWSEKNGSGFQCGAVQCIHICSYFFQHLLLLRKKNNNKNWSKILLEVVCDRGQFYTARCSVFHSVARIKDCGERKLPIVVTFTLFPHFLSIVSILVVC